MVLIFLYNSGCCFDYMGFVLYSHNEESKQEAFGCICVFFYTIIFMGF